MLMLFAIANAIAAASTKPQPTHHGLDAKVAIASGIVMLEEWLHLDGTRCFEEEGRYV